MEKQYWRDWAAFRLPPHGAHGPRSRIQGDGMVLSLVNTDFPGHGDVDALEANYRKHCSPTFWRRAAPWTAHLPRSMQR